ncbi:MAG: DUF3500 domain-containing protein [Pirellulaceae bacterium]
MRILIALMFSSLLMVYLPAQEKPATDTQLAKQTDKKPNAALQLMPATKAFLESLNEQQREKASVAFDSEQRVKWHFIPMATRKGLPLMEMEAAQQEAAMKLMRAAVSKLGYDKATTIMQLETVLKELEAGKGTNERNPEKYYFTVFGKPEQGARWGLSIEGHHLSLNFVLNGNRIVDSTPQFFASNPAELKDSYGDKFPKGMKVLGSEEQLGFALVRSLDAQQLAKAQLPGKTPSEIRGAGEAQPPTEPLGGLAAADLNDEQKEILKKLMMAYTNKMKPGVSKSRWKLIDEAGFDKITFAWSGAKKPGVGHYYVIQGPTFVIEFINVQPDAAGNPANHIHCVWRDMQGDFDLPIK